MSVDLRSGTFKGFLVLVLLGWTLEGLLQPVIPLLILERGGDAVVVGLVAAMYAIPSVVLRPFIGRMVDRRGHDLIQRAGALALGVAPLLFLVPALPAAGVARLGQGLGWSFYSTANNVLLAVLAPKERRGEASGYYNTTRALGLLIGPPVGLWLFSMDPSFALVAGSVVGVACFIGATRLRVPSKADVGPVVDSVPVGTTETLGLWSRVFEPSAVPAMLMIATFMASQTVFLVFGPVYATAIGADAFELALLFVAFGGTLTLAPLVGGRVSDRIGRRAAILCGSAIATVGLLIAIAPGGMVTFTIGAAWIAVAIAVATPAIASSTMDSAPAGRLGSALATYSVGYALASGAGGALWGLVIALFGFPWPLVGAIALQAVAALIAWRFVPAMTRPKTEVQR